LWKVNNITFKIILLLLSFHPSLLSHNYISHPCVPTSKILCPPTLIYSHQLFSCHTILSVQVQTGIFCNISFRQTLILLFCYNLKLNKRITAETYWNFYAFGLDMILTNNVKTAEYLLKSKIELKYTSLYTLHSTHYSEYNTYLVI